ncbi:MAG: PAS domain S-box protein [Thiobacillus sp.]|nr:PAS domain S-box protein [Thiobacillus sp.]
MTHARILIVEDDPDTIYLLEYWLRANHYQCIGTVATGHEALALANAEHPDLVLMECGLPGELDGIETADILLERYDIPVLYLAATTDEALLERAPAACLTKPFSERELRRAVEAALDRHALLIRLKASEAHLAEAQAVAQQKLDPRAVMDRHTEQAAKRFRMALESAPDAIFLIDPATMRFIDANETACASLGYTREELLARGPDDIKPLFSRTRLSERFDRVLSGQPDAGTIQTLHQRKDGSTFPVEVSLRPFAAEGKSLMVVVARDITARQLAELHLKEANERFQQFAENINEAFWIRDLEEDRFLYISPAFETLFRRPVSSLYQNARAFLGAVHPDDLERVTAAFVWQREHRQGIELEYRIIIGDHVIRWLWVRTFPIRNEQGKVYRMAGIAEDMTRRREYDERYRTMIQASLDGFLALDTQGRIMDCNDAYIRMMGYSREELLQLSIADLDFRESPEQAAEHIRLITERGQDRFETQHLHKNGRLINMEINIHYRPDSRGGQLLAFIHDISQRKQAERTLHRSVARYRSILRAAPVGIGVLVHRVFQEVNEAMVRMTGYRTEELVGQSARMLYPTQADFDYVGMEKYRQIQTHGIGSVETRWLRKDGEVIHILLSSSPIVEDDLAQGVTFTALDVTASKQAEQERLVHEASQRDALVREVHHRIKNNLQGVIGLLRQHITENPGIQPALESAIAQVNTVAVIHGLQSRLPQQELQLRELLLEVSNAAAAMALVPHSPTIQDTQPGDVWLDSGATVTIALILNELIHNAFKHGRHADGTGVTITLSGDDKLTTVHISNPGDSWPGNLNLTTGTGCGTGLDLIRTLLPRHGAQLNLYEDGVMLHAELVLSAPVIHASEYAEPI